MKKKKRKKKRKERDHCTVLFSVIKNKEEKEEKFPLHLLSSFPLTLSFNPPSSTYIPFANTP
jgi:hypothetical protein